MGSGQGHRPCQHAPSGRVLELKPGTVTGALTRAGRAVQAGRWACRPRRASAGGRPGGSPAPRGRALSGSSGPVREPLARAARTLVTGRATGRSRCHRRFPGGFLSPRHWGQVTASTRDSLEPGCRGSGSHRFSTFSSRRRRPPGCPAGAGHLSSFYLRNLNLTHSPVRLSAEKFPVRRAIPLLPHCSSAVPPNGSFKGKSPPTHSGVAVTSARLFSVKHTPPPAAAGTECVAPRAPPLPPANHFLFLSPWPGQSPPSWAQLRSWALSLPELGDHPPIPSGAPVPAIVSATPL